MSAHILLKKGKIGCASCGAHWDYLDPKSSNDGDVYYCRCRKCGYEDNYVWPKVCFLCDHEDWANYESDSYPEFCPYCKGKI